MAAPITGAAVLILQDEGKLKVADPLLKYLPEFANSRTVFTHASGLDH